jgi:ribosomal protein S18 acetylase RimI-like enzyme
MRIHPPVDRPLVVREARPDDLDMVVPLFDAYREFYGVPADPRATRSFLAARQARGESLLLVAVEAVPDGSSPDERKEAHDPMLGFAHLYPSFSSVSLRKIWILNDLYVPPAHRRSSVARRLIAFSAAYAMNDGAVRVELATQIANTPARRLYDSLGFAPDVEFMHMTLALPHPQQ